MAINNRINTDSNSGGDFLDVRDIKKDVNGIKVRLSGNQEMGYSYFQKQDDDTVKVIRSKDTPEMKNPTDGYQGAEQTPSKVLYSKAWDYAQEKPVVLILDKVSIINNILAVEDNEDLATMNDYDFRISFDDKKVAAEKYSVVRLDKSDLTKEQTEALESFDFDLAKFAEGVEETKVEEDVKKEDVPF